MVEQRQPVPEPFDALQEPDQTGVIQRFQSAILEEFDQVIKTDMEGIQGLFGCVGIPDIHAHSLLEHTFDLKEDRQENKENLGA